MREFPCVANLVLKQDILQSIVPKGLRRTESLENPLGGWDQMTTHQVISKPPQVSENTFHPDPPPQPTPLSSLESNQKSKNEESSPQVSYEGPRVYLSPHPSAC
jgi:hypothetical protein